MMKKSEFLRLIADAIVATEKGDDGLDDKGHAIRLGLCLPDTDEDDPILRAIRGGVSFRSHPSYFLYILSDVEMAWEYYHRKEEQKLTREMSSSSA